MPGNGILAGAKTVFRRIGTLLFWACIATGVVWFGVLFFVYMRFTGVFSLPADCAIVFGTAVRPLYDAQGEIVSAGPGPGILRRVGTAARLYREGSVKKLFLSGGKGEGMVESEASVMRRIALSDGVAAADIVTEEASTSTDENLRNTLPLMGDCRSIVGVSDRYHLARIEILSWFAGRRIQTYPASPVPDEAFETRSTIREVFGVMFIAIQHILT